jgi:hypothetical protein
MSLSFREKSLWLLLISPVAAFGYYFASVLPPQSPNITPQHIVTFVGMTVLLVFAQIVGNILLAVGSRRELAGHIQSDERDERITGKGMRIASYVLATGVFTSLCIAVVIPGNFVFVHVLLAFWVFAQAAEITTQLVLYRRGL